MNRAAMSARDRALLEGVRELLLAYRADISLEMEDRFAALERTIRQVPRMTAKKLTGETHTTLATPPSTHLAGPAPDPEPTSPVQGREPSSRHRSKQR